jgi:hypothetical protein
VAPARGNVAAPVRASAGSGGGVSSSLTIAPGAIVIHQQPGQSAQQLADEVIRRIEQKTRMKLA